VLYYYCLIKFYSFISVFAFAVILICMVNKCCQVLLSESHIITLCNVCGCFLAVPSSAAGGDQQFFQISFTPATAAYPAVSQSVVLVAPAVGTQNLPVLAAGSHTVVPGSHAWMEVTSFPPVIVKPQSAVSDLANSRCVLLYVLLLIILLCV